MAQSDAELMDQVRRRQAVAFELILHRYEDIVRGHLRRMVRSESTADDLTQEVFLRLWTRSEQWTGQGSLCAWLLSIATHLALNHMRGVRRRRQQPLSLSADEDDEQAIPSWMLDESAPEPDAPVLDAERSEIINRLVAGLPEAKRDVLRLVLIEEMRLADAAQMLGIPVGTAKSRLHYACRELAEMLGDEET